MTPVDRTRWSDDRMDDLVDSIDRRFGAVDKRLNSMPDRLKTVELTVGSNTTATQECKAEIRKLADAVTASRQGMTRTEKFMFAGVVAAFIGSLSTAGALLFA